MKNFVEKKSSLNEEEINELLYYYEQGISIGKEETILRIINNLIKLEFDEDIIANIINIEKNKLEQLIN